LYEAALLGDVAEMNVEGAVGADLRAEGDVNVEMLDGGGFQKNSRS